jgi:hypothetical protein
LAALEAMACGLPVVMPATGAFWDWRPESFFEAAVWSYPHFSAALDRALSEADRCSPRTDLIQARIFTPAHCLNAWRDLVRQVLEEHPR